MPPAPDFFWWFPALKTLVVLAVLAIGFWPLTTRVFRGAPARGAGLAVSGGLFAFILLSQIGWRLGLNTHHASTLWGLSALASAACWFFLRPAPLSPGTLARMRGAALRSVLLFAGAFVFWTIIRSANPGISHTEQPMDAMWMRAAMASEAPPLRDAWFGGAPATYYAEGHQMLAFVALLLGEPASVAIHLGQILWFALCAQLAHAAADAIAGRRAGRLAVALLLFVSTPQGAWDALRGGEEHWWWWRASRVLRDGTTELITEFPFFSFWLGDNHAHLLGVPLLLLSIGIAASIVRQRRLDLIQLLPAGLAVVWSWRVNSWQMPTALALPLLAFLCRKHLRPRDGGILAAGLALPLVLLFPAPAGGLFQGLALNTYGYTSAVEALQVFGFLLPGLLFLLAPGRPRLAVALTLLGLGLFAACEGVVIQDAFQSRMNTVFKLYYQIWILAAVAAAVGWGHALKEERLRLPALFSLFLPSLGMIYAALLCGGAFAVPRRSLDAWSVLPAETQRLLRTADALLRPGERIAEAPGESYNADTSLLGTWTAGNSVLGWQGHQAQWRPGTPHPDLSPLYSAKEEGELQGLLRLFDIHWVLLGPRERALYSVSAEWERWMDRQGDRVIDDARQRLWRLR